MRNYEYVRDVGGRLGSNVKLYKNNHGELVILKRFSNDEQKSGVLKRESSMLNFQHPLILPINNIFSDKDYTYIETPYIEDGTLKAWLQNGQVKTRSELTNMIYLIAQGVDVLHNHGIVHCDLKPENILIRRNIYDGTSAPVICDFEMCINSNNSSGVSSTRGGTLMYLSPERYVKGHKPSTKADVWSLGIIILEMISYPHDVSISISAYHSKQIDSLLEDLGDYVSSLYELLTKMLADVNHRCEIVDVIHALNIINNRNERTVQMRRYILEKCRQSADETDSIRINSSKQSFV